MPAVRILSVELQVVNAGNSREAHEGLESMVEKNSQLCNRRRIIVKPLVGTLLVSTLLEPLASLGQETNESLTRAQVREQIVQLEQAGYTPGSFDPHYPERIQAAQARVNGEGKKKESERANAIRTPP